MKRLFLILIMALVGMSLFAATTGTLTLTGIVAASTNITVTPQTGYNTLDLNTTQTNFLVAVVNEQSNDHLGYTVAVASFNLANAGTQPFFKDIASGNTLNYSLQYKGIAVVFAGGTATVTDVNANTAAIGVNNNLNVSYTGSDALSASNSYADTLTFTISTKQ